MPEDYDLTIYGDDELALRVFNIKYLYADRHNKGFVNALEAMFEFNGSQRDALIAALAADLEEVS